MRPVKVFLKTLIALAFFTNPCFSIPPELMELETTHVSSRQEPPINPAIKAPYPGKITKFFVQPGDIIEAGDLLFEHECMKMITHIHARFAGRLAEVYVREGSIVGANTLLMLVIPGAIDQTAPDNPLDPIEPETALSSRDTLSPSLREGAQVPVEQSTPLLVQTETADELPSRDDVPFSNDLFLLLWTPRLNHGVTKEYMSFRNLIAGSSESNSPSPPTRSVQAPIRKSTSQLVQIKAMHGLPRSFHSLAMTPKNAESLPTTVPATHTHPIRQERVSSEHNFTSGALKLPLKESLALTILLFLGYIASGVFLSPPRRIIKIYVARTEYFPVTTPMNINQFYIERKKAA